MKTTLDCIPCMIRQTLDTARFLTDDPKIHERVLRGVLRGAADMELVHSPPHAAQGIQRLLREVTGQADPYATAKHQFNELALKMLPALQEQVRTATDPFLTALRLAIAGNVIDMGVAAGITLEQVHQSIANVMHEPFVGDVEDLRHTVMAADNILYLADNTGEIVFDQLLISQLPRERVTVAVRGMPVLNDATMLDAEETGLTKLVQVIDNGSDAPGTILEDCSEAFRQQFADADVVVAKGQGNYETLSGSGMGKVFFLLKVKCQVVADQVSFPVGAQVVVRGTDS